MADLNKAPPRVLLARSAGTRVGEGLEASGSIAEVAMQRTLDAVRGYARAVQSRCDKFFVIATSALRRAKNTDEFARAIEAELGVVLRVVDGDEEAAASYAGAAAAVAASPQERIGVIDVGGGSTEYAIGRGAQPDRVCSCEIGAVRLTEMFPELAGADGFVSNATVVAARHVARKALANLANFSAVGRLVFVGGSATTAVAVIRGHRRRFVTAPIGRGELRDAFNSLCELPLRRRKLQPGMNPQRADILPAGMLLLDVALELLEKDHAIVSAWDLLLGYLLRERISAA